MNRRDLIARVRSYTRDLSDSIFRQIDIVSFLNEAIDRIRGRVWQLAKMKYLDNDQAVPEYLPESFHYLLAVYASARCFGQDEQHYQASTLMNEFEVKLEELIGLIEEGVIVITDGEGNPIDDEMEEDYVRLVYFSNRRSEV